LTKINVTGGIDAGELKALATSMGPSTDGTYAHIGSQGGTEQMMAGLKKRVPADLLDKFNIICSRVRTVDQSKKNILWLHDTWDDPESEHLEKEESRKRFTKLVFVSHYQQATYNIGRGVPHSDGVVLQNAIVPIPEHEKPTGNIRLIYHTTPHRGLDLLVPVVEKIAESVPGIHLDVFSSFKIYGWGKRDEDYAKLFQRIERHPNMTYHGFQPNDVVREALQRAHIYAYPCIWPETSCISVLEAMSAGCEVVCPSFAALPETCANFASMYPFVEDYNQHANIFYSVLMSVIRNYRSDGGANKRKYQKTYFDNFYSWDYRATQWTGFLKSLT
jgi:glycosyltransferase involved in cell wall biosynthesis